MLPASAIEEIDYNAVLSRIEKFRPKILNISGGEPTLVSGLADILCRAKETWNPFIRIVHNGTQPSKAVPFFPWLDRLVVSLDGPAEINRASRGLDGAAVIRRLAEILPDAKKYKVELAINCVITKNNALRIRELAGAITAASPDIILSLTPLMPPGSPDSLFSYPQLLKEFLAEADLLKKQGHNIMHTFDSLMRHPDFSGIQCFNQYFVIRVTPEGRISSCPMNIPFGDALSNVRRPDLAGWKGIRKTFRVGSRMLAGRFALKPDFTCTTICNCESWLDMLLLGKQCNGAGVYLRALRCRMNDEDYSKLDFFVRANINADFNVESFKKMVESV
jgi:MoaA/NifB/PqqE/SkfB family radical SAM enzyme